MSETLSGSSTVVFGGETVFGLCTGANFGIVYGAFAGTLFVETMCRYCHPKALLQGSDNFGLFV